MTERLRLRFFLPVAQGRRENQHNGRRKKNGTWLRWQNAFKSEQRIWTWHRTNETIDGRKSKGGISPYITLASSNSFSIYIQCVWRVFQQVGRSIFSWKSVSIILWWRVDCSPKFLNILFVCQSIYWSRKWCRSHVLISAYPAQRLVTDPVWCPFYPCNFIWKIKNASIFYKADMSRTSILVFGISVNSSKFIPDQTVCVHD